LSALRDGEEWSGRHSTVLREASSHRQELHVTLVAKRREQDGRDLHRRDRLVVLDGGR